MPVRFVFFDLGQTLVDERDFIRYFDDRLFDLLDAYGARIDRRTYATLRDSVIPDRLIGHGGVGQLVTEVAKLIHRLDIATQEAASHHQTCENDASDPSLFPVSSCVESSAGWLSGHCESVARYGASPE